MQNSRVWIVVPVGVDVEQTVAALNLVARCCFKAGSALECRILFIVFI